MSSVKDLHAQAALLLAVSMQARERGDVAYAEQLILRAGQLLDEIQARESGAPPPSAAPAQPMAQQQQQPQPKNDDNKD